jgi:hypothetical protein
MIEVTTHDGGEMMGPEEQLDQEAAVPGPVPEQWETAIEDAAQVVAMGLDRAQDLADVINDFARTHPTVMKTLLAAGTGALVGAFIAERTFPRRKVSLTGAAAAAWRDVAARRSAVVEEAGAVARQAAERLARRAPSRAELEQVVARANGLPRPGRRPALPNPRDVRYAAQLVPITLALLKNPLVRQLLWRSVTRAARR